MSLTDNMLLARHASDASVFKQMGKLNVAILTGGNVAERGISLGSAKTVFDHLDKSKYQSYIIELNGTAFTEQSTGRPVDLKHILIGFRVIRE